MKKEFINESNGFSKLCRRSFIYTSALGIGGTFIAANTDEQELKIDMLKLLSMAGVREASELIGLNFEQTFAPLAREMDHPYNRYRWSVSYAATGGPIIQALPPEEEMGWTPWEEWFTLNGHPVRRAMVLYPVKEMTRNMPLWWVLEQSQTDLLPRRLGKVKTLGELFRRDRIFEAASVVGFDAQKLIIEHLSPNAQDTYMQMRWSVAPHRLAADLPVIQCLPPKDKLNKWPWETWYTDGKTPLIHHVHYAHPTGRTASKSWSERHEAPQRPFELFGHNWYWYNDESMTPALAGRI